jgi:hypothetical protein
MNIRFVAFYDPEKRTLPDMSITPNYIEASADQRQRFSGKEHQANEQR